MSGATTEQKIESGGNGGAAPELQIKYKPPKPGKPSGTFEVSNQEALEALAEFGAAGDSIRVERVGPATHDGKRVQLGDLPITVTTDDLRDPARLHGLLGPRGREFLIKAGKRAIRFKPVGHDLTALDYEPEEKAKEVPHTVVVGPNGVPMAVPVPQPTGFPQNPYASPWGMYPMAQPLPQPDAIAKVVADAIASTKKDESSQKMLLEIEEKRIQREEKKAEREEKERREERERREAGEKERRDREDRDRREAREREEKRADREEKDKKERDERDRKDREERERRWLEEQKESRAERLRAHELEQKRIEENARVQLEIAKRQADAAESAAKIAAQSQKDFFEMRLKELDAQKGEAPDPLEMLERLKRIADGPRSTMGEFLKEAPALVKAMGEEFSRVKSTPPALPAPSNAPSDPLKTLTRDELFSAIRTFGDAIRGGHTVEQVLPIMRRPKVCKPDGSMGDGSGVPNMIEKCRIDAPEKVLMEIQGLLGHPSASEAEKALIGEVLGLAASDKGKAWLLEFFARVRG